MSDVPKVSVMMPTLDVVNYIEDSINSVLCQNLSDIELLILDGGSTDGTLEYCKSISDPRVRVFENSGGRVEARQKGVAESKGKYLAVVDSDTVLYQSRLKKGVEFLKNNPAYGAVGSFVKRIEPDGSTWIDEKPISYESIIDQLVWKNAMVHPTLVLRKKAVEAVGGYRKRYYEDYDLIVRLGREYKLANQSEVLLDYYIREEGTVQSLSSFKNAVSTLRCSLLAIWGNNHSLHKKFGLSLERFLFEGLKLIYNIIYYRRVD